MISNEQPKCKECDTPITRGTANKSGLCKKCWRRDNKKKNLDKIRKQQTSRYLQNRDRRLQMSKDWQKSHKDRVNIKCKERYHKNPKRKNVRGETLRIYGHLIRSSVCQNCGSNDRLEFHHPEPYKIDNFVILCFNCHRVLHGQLFPQFVIPKNQCSFEDGGVKHD